MAFVKLNGETVRTSSWGSDVWETLIGPGGVAGSVARQAADRLRHPSLDRGPVPCNCTGACLRPGGRCAAAVVNDPSLVRPVDRSYVVRDPVGSMLDRPCFWSDLDGRWKPRFGSDPADARRVDADCSDVMEAG